MGAKYKLNPPGFRKNILQADFMLAEMEYRANKIKDEAEATAPKYTGAYARRFGVRVLKNGGVHRDRAAGIVYNTDPGALAIEFGHFTATDDSIQADVPFRRAGTYVPGTYTLTKAMDAAGGSA